MSLTVTCPAARSSPPTTVTKRDAARRRVLELLAELVRLGIDLDANARARAGRRPAAARLRPAFADRTASPARRPPPTRTPGGNISRSAITTRIRSSPSEKPHAGRSLAGEHADQAVVAAAAAEAAREIRHGDLHDRAGVVRQAARQARIDEHVIAGAGRRGTGARSRSAFATAASPVRVTRRRARAARSRHRVRVAHALAAARRRGCRTPPAAARPPPRRRRARPAPPPRRRARSCRACRPRPAPDRAASAGDAERCRACPRSSPR